MNPGQESRTAAVVKTVVQAVNGSPAIRADKVERAKKALADGTLGADASRLAEALLDHMLDNR